MNDQNWPLVTTAEPGDRADEFTNPAEGERYILLLEQARGSGDYRTWEIEKLGTSYVTREQARAAARYAADIYKPEHPMFPKTRDVFQQNPDCYVVAIGGMTTVFYFRISVLERI